MSKQKIGCISLTIPAGKATPSPPIGPALGQRGVNIMEFCKSFNAATQKLEPGTPIPVVITVYKDKSFTFITKTPPVSFFLKKFTNVKKGASATKRGPSVGEVTKSQCYEIAKTKLPDLNAYDLDAAFEMIKGSAISMGIEVVEG